MSSWNDDRLDKRDEEVKEGFARLEGQVMANRRETAEGFAEMRSAYTSLNRTLLMAAGGIIAALIGATSALVVTLVA